MMELIRRLEEKIKEKKKSGKKTLMVKKIG